MGGIIHSDEAYLQAIRSQFGIIAAVANQLKVTRQTVYNRCKKSAELREALKDAREDLKDLAESQLLQAVRQGNLTAIIFFLKCQGKDRGYIEKQELGIVGDQDLNFTVATAPGGFTAEMERGSSADTGEQEQLPAGDNGRPTA